MNRTPPAKSSYDAEGGAERLWHELWKTIEDDVPSMAMSSYPTFVKVKAFEARIRDELLRAYEAGAKSRRA